MASCSATATGSLMPDARARSQKASTTSLYFSDIFRPYPRGGQERNIAVSRVAHNNRSGSRSVTAIAMRAGSHRHDKPRGMAVRLMTVHISVTLGRTSRPDQPGGDFADEAPSLRQ